MLDINDECIHSSSLIKIKAKKAYELEKFSEIIKRESKEIGGINRIVDVGCGMVRFK